MATLAAYPEWYDRSGGVVQRQDITEVAVVSSYAPTGNEVVSWNAASEGEIMCHIVGTKLTIVWGDLTEIPDKMFTYFISLKKIAGLNAVTVIGKSAFYQCHCLKSVDLIPEKLTKIGDDAFRISSMEDVLDVSRLPATAEVGARATRKQRWGDELTVIQAMPFPKKRIFLNVANPDSQLKDVYKEVPFLTDEETGEVTKTLYEGCSRFALYHAWNALYAGTDKEYPDMLSWWNATLNADRKFAERTHDITFTLSENYATLGWEYAGNEHFTDASQLSYILNELSCGFPVYVGIKTSSAYHAILIVGCDPITRKLAYVDSGAREDRGIVCWVAYEDLFIGGDGEPSEMIRKIDFKPPTLAPNCSWFTQGGTTVKRASITEIEIVREYTPTGNETASWDASADKNGSVMAYVNGAKLTIAGNGYPSVWANSDSSWAFSDSAKSDLYSKLTTIVGAPLLNTSKVVDMQRMFRQCIQLGSVDVSNWDTSRVTNMLGTFDRCGFETVAVDNWDVSSVVFLSGMFQICSNLETVNVSKWDTHSCTDMAGIFTSCTKLTDVDVSNWNTDACATMNVMFAGTAIRFLDLSNWDTSNVTTMDDMFYNVTSLEKISIGDKFDFKDATQPKPSSSVPLADGNWYDSELNAYAPANIQSNVARTYYASKFLAADDDDTMVFVRNGTLRKLAVAIRHKSGKSDTMLPSAFAEEVLALEVLASE